MGPLPRLRVWLIAILGTTACYAVPLRLAFFSPGFDWNYFDSLALLVRSTVLHYGTWPMHDPWMCGGLDVLANPQSRVFSPFLLTDLLLSPHIANLVSLWVCGVVGWL